MLFVVSKLGYIGSLSIEMLYIRWLLLSAQYRQSVDWSEDSIHKAQKTMDRIYAVLRDNADIKATVDSNNIQPTVIDALNDDLNTVASNIFKFF